MTVMTQAEMQILVKGSNILDDRSIDIREAYMAPIAVAALGDDKAHLAGILDEYAGQLEAEMAQVTFFREESRIAAVEHIVWLRSFAS